MHGKVKFALGMVPTKLPRSPGYCNSHSSSKQITQINGWRDGQYLVKVTTFDACMTFI